MRKPFPMVGNKPPMSTDERLREIQRLVQDNNRALDQARAIGREHLTRSEQVEHLTRQGKQVNALLDSYLASARLPDTVTERTRALDWLAKLHVCADVPASDLRVIAMATRDAVLEDGGRQTPPASAPATSYVLAVTFTAADGVALVGDDLAEAKRLGGGGL